MVIIRRQVLLSLLWWGLCLATVPLHAQTTTGSTGGSPSASNAIEREIYSRFVAPKKMEGYLKQNSTLEGRDGLTKTLDQLRIRDMNLKGFDLKNLSKKGGVDSGGGDQLGLEFQSALIESQLDYKQYSYDDMDTFIWTDLSIYGSTLTVVAADKMVKENGEASFRVAENDVAKKVIRVNRAIWNSIRDRRIKNAIALNQVLLMRDGKASGFTARALEALSGAGISGMALYNGQAAPLDAKEAQQTRQHQCLWSFKTLARVSKAFESEIVLCSYEGKPAQYFVRASQIESLVSRCETLCSTQADLQSIAKKCHDYRTQYSQIVRAAKNIQPMCMPEAK